MDATGGWQFDAKDEGGGYKEASERTKSGMIQALFSRSNLSNTNFSPSTKHTIECESAYHGMEEKKKGKVRFADGKQGEVGSLEHFCDVEVVSNDGSSKDSRSGNSVYSLDTHNLHSLRQTMEGGEAVTALRTALSGSGKIILKKTSISADNSAGIQTE